jgi:hypothetical protein
MVEDLLLKKNFNEDNTEIMKNHEKIKENR